MDHAVACPGKVLSTVEARSHHAADGGNQGIADNRLSLSSGAPWNLTCTVAALGADLVCQIQGGASHVGAVAVSQWDGARAQTRSWVIDPHKEGPIATHAAHKLCLATHRPVVCIAGIHFDAPTAEQIRAISDAAHDLIVQAAAQLTQQRYERALHDSNSSHARLNRGIVSIREEVGAFMEQPLEVLLNRHRRRAQGLQRQYFDNRILLFAPLYLGNACLNDCAYCGFRRGVRQRRIQLQPERVVEQARILARRGHRTIDLVSGEIPSDAFTRHVCRVIGAIRAATPIQHINLNLGSLTSLQYEELRSAGATGYHLYQETYDPETYFRVHRAGPKRHMEARLAGLHRAALAGFQQLGLGILLGLREGTDDLAALVRHAELLLEDHPRVRLGFSLPRIQPAHGQRTEQLPAAVPDEFLVKALLFLRLRFPQAALTVTTRESPTLRDLLVPLVVTKMSAGVSTVPGGYLAAQTAAGVGVGEGLAGEHGQFALHDVRSLQEVRRAVLRNGCVPVYE